MIKKKSVKYESQAATPAGGEVKPSKKNFFKSLKRGAEWLLWIALISITLGLITYFGVQWRREIGDLKNENTQLKSKIDGLERNISELNQGRPDIDLNEYLTIDEWGVRMKDLSGPGTRYVHSKETFEGVESETVWLTNSASQSFIKDGLTDSSCESGDLPKGVNILFTAQIYRVKTSQLPDSSSQSSDLLGIKDGYSYFLSLSQESCVSNPAYAESVGKAYEELRATAKSIEL